MPVTELSMYKPLYSEVATFGHTVSQSIANHIPPEEVNLTALGNRLEGNLVALEGRTGVKTDTDTLDDEVKASDQKRDATYNEMLQHVRGLVTNLKERTAGSASVILDVFERHDTKLTTYTFESESHLMKALLTELKNPQYAEHIANLEIGDHIAKLDAEQKECDKIYNERIAVNSTTEDPPQLIKFVTPIRKTLTQITGYLNIVETVNSTMYKATIDEINEALGLLIPRILSRKTRKDNKDKPKN